MVPVPATSTTTDLPDTEIARRIAAGDIDALRRLMRRYNQRLYRTARGILKDDGEAEDAVQEAYLLAYGAMGDFRGDAQLSTWPVRIVVNEAIGRLRKRNRRAELIALHGDLDPDLDLAEVPMSADSSDAPDHAALRAELRRLIEVRIDQLPDAFRTVFVLRALEDMTVEETADCLRIPVATVRTRYFRARGLLREALAREIDIGLDDAYGFAGERCDRIVARVLARLALPSGA